MTALCGGGSSQPKAGYAAVVDFSGGLIAQLLSARGLRWLIPAIPIAAIGPVELASFCSTDPPALPTFTLAETTALLTLTFGSDYNSGVSKLRDLIHHTVWYEICECAAGSPTTYVAPTMPTDTPVFQPPIPDDAVPCQTFEYVSAACDAGNVNKGGPTLSAATPATSLVYNMIGTQCGTAGAYNGNWSFTQIVNSVDTRTDTWNMTAATQSKQLIVPAVPGLTAIRLNHNQLSGPSGQAVTGSTIEIYCNGDAPGAQDPCCPPDESTQSYLDLILKMVTLIQRQSAPFSYVYGAAHDGLTGDGQFAVSGVLGLSVAVVARPDRVGVAAGTPETLWDVGYVTLGTSDGWLVSRRIDRDGCLVLPLYAGVFTSVGYTLAPDVEVDIRELIREP